MSSVSPLTVLATMPSFFCAAFMMALCALVVASHSIHCGSRETSSRLLYTGCADHTACRALYDLEGKRQRADATDLSYERMAMTDYATRMGILHSCATPSPRRTRLTASLLDQTHEDTTASLGLTVCFQDELDSAANGDSCQALLLACGA